MSDSEEQGPDRSVRVWTGGGLIVNANWDAYLDCLVIRGDDSRHPLVEEGAIASYEYAIAVDAVDVPALLQALGAPADAEVLSVIEQRGAELVRTGETRWLEQHGIPFDFSVR